MKTARCDPPQRLARYLRRRRWHTRSVAGRRLVELLDHRYPWYDYGHPLMALVGRDFCGNWDEPRPPTWFYRPGPMRRQPVTGYPRRTLEVVKGHEAFRARELELRDVIEHDEWKALCVDSDGDLVLGRRYWGGSFYGLDYAERALLARYLRHWRLLDWFGLRSWLYHVGLKAAVHRRRPFACNVTPPRGSGGYSHWYCDLRRRHAGDHRFGSYTWDGAATSNVEYDPDVAS